MKNDLVTALEALAPESETGAFACKLQLPADALRIAIKEVGNIRLPVSTSRARTLIRHARQAPFGFGEETLFDTRIRNVWEIAKSRVQIDNRHWNQSLKPALEEIRLALDLPDGKLGAKLDKLLIYEAGQFFVPHRDSERSDDMMATLVVVLPSEHTGGSLIVNHKDRRTRFSIRNAAAGKLTLFSFYADCTHEVKPITDGYRIALSYNLNFTPAKPKRGVQPKQDTTELQRTLNAFFTQPADSDSTVSSDAIEKFVYLLDHQYTQRSLSWNRFKGSDKSRADALKIAGNALDMHVNLCLVDIKELWSAFETNGSDYDGFSRSYRGYNHYDQDWDDEDEDAALDADDATASENAGSEYDLEELLEDSVILTHWVTGDKAPYSTLHVSNRELCWTRARDEFAPAAEEYEGYMGNYGNTLDRQYERAAVVMWPQNMHLRILFKMDEVIGMRELLSLAKLDAAKAVQEAMIIFDTQWPNSPRRASSASLSATLKLLLLLDDRSLSARALAAFTIDAVNKSQIKPLIKLGVKHGKSFCEQLVTAWIERQDKRYRYVPLDWIERLPRFCEQVNELGGSAWKRVPERLWHFYFDKLIQEHEINSLSAAPTSRLADSDHQVNHLVALYRSAQCLPNTKAKTVLLQHVHHKRQIYLEETLVFFLESLSTLEHDAPCLHKLRTLSQLLIDTLGARLAKPPRAPNDWRMSVELDCKCADCSSLSAFLSSPEQYDNMPLAKNRRLHLHGKIDYAELPVSHVTLRKGSPYVLQLSKKRVLFKIDKKRRTQDMKLLAKVESLEY